MYESLKVIERPLHCTSVRSINPLSNLMEDQCGDLYRDGFVQQWLNPARRKRREYTCYRHVRFWFRLFFQSKILFLSRIIASCKFRAAIRSLINVICHYGVSSAFTGFDVLVDNVRWIKIVEIYTRKSNAMLLQITWRIFRYYYKNILSFILPVILTKISICILIVYFTYIFYICDKRQNSAITSYIYILYYWNI